MKAKTKREIGANYHNDKPANCLVCNCNGKDCYPDEPEEYKWDCNSFEEED